MISSFLSPMMRLNPEKRARAADMVNHVWLEGIVVQGEIDLILMAEAAERKERGRSGSRATGSQRTTSSSSKSKSKSGSKGGSQRRPSGPRDPKSLQALNEAAVADAMRPVDEAALLGGNV
jgi:serine/threonine-protein kinase SRPK3